MNKVPMWLYSFITTAFLLFSYRAYAENVMQFTGGNYVYAENGKLTFNLERDLFKNRNWTYNPATQAIETTFTTRAIDFKTKHSSSFHLYPSNAQLTPSASPYIRPVYQPHMMHGFGQQRVVLPAVAGFVVRVGGRILVNLLPPLVSRCLSNANCASAVGGAAVGGGLMCFIQYHVQLLNLPKGVCDKAEEAGWQSDGKGNYTKSGMVKFAGLSGDPHYTKDKVSGYPSSIDPKTIESQAESIFKPICVRAVEKHFVHDKNAANRVLRVHAGVNDSKTEANITCNIAGASGFDYINFHYKGEITETLTMMDLSNFVAEDIKDNPNDYVNDSGQLGTNILNTTQVTESDFFWESGNGFSLYSSPYRDSNGNTKQDVVHLGKSKPDNSAKPSGTASEGTAGTSIHYNPVTVNNISRPDLESDSKAGENNNANGNNPPANGSSSGSNGTGKEGEQQGRCEGENADTAGCAKLGDITDDGTNLFSGAIGKIENNTQYSPDNFLPSNGTCPAPKQVVLMGKTYHFSYDLFCEYSRMIRAIVIAIAFITAGFIIFGRKRT